MIVVDVNVVAYLLIAGDSTILAQAVWDLDSDWCLPSLWRHEMLNVLATYVKVGGSTLEQAQVIWTEAVRLFAGGEREVDLGQALALAAQYGISAYDAQYVELASQLRLPLVTEDRRLRQKLQGLLSMQEFCDLSSAR